jgi:hypothetical protein
MGTFREHQLRLFLDRRLSMRFTELRADKGLGRSFAGLLCFVEGLHRLGHLGERDYELYRKRYSTPLDKDPEQVALMEVHEAKKRKELRELFGQCVAQFQIYKEKEGWVDFYREKAMKHGELPEAKKLLALIEEERGS